MKTVVLTSASSVSGTAADCFVEIKEGLLDSFKQYRCRVRLFHAMTSVLQPLFLYIDGLAMQSFYTNHFDKSLFACLTMGDFIEVGTNSWQVLSEPRAHSRDVTVSNNILRVRLTGTYNQPAAITGNWTMEMQFEEL